MRPVPSINNVFDTINYEMQTVRAEPVMLCLCFA
jgi:hypothetical protein